MEMLLKVIQNLFRPIIKPLGPQPRSSASSMVSGHRFSRDCLMMTGSSDATPSSF